VPLVVGAGGLDQPVALQAAQRRVDLPTFSGQVAPVRDSNSARSW